MFHIKYNNIIKFIKIIYKFIIQPFAVLLLKVEVRKVFRNKLLLIIIFTNEPK